MELYGFLPFIHDDLPNLVRGVDRASLGLYEGRGQSGKIDTLIDEVNIASTHSLILGRGRVVSSNIFTCPCDGELYGSQPLLGPAPQQLQLRRAQVQKRGKG